MCVCLCFPSGLLSTNANQVNYQLILLNEFLIVITYAFMCIIRLHIFCLTENLPGVLDVRFAEKAPAEKRCLLSWEQVWYFKYNKEYSQSRTLMWVCLY